MERRTATMDFESFLPVHIVFGENKLQELGVHVRQLGRRALVVATGSFFEKTGLIGRVRKYLEAEGVASDIYLDVSPNPRSDEADRGAAQAKRSGCDVIIGVGGGSAIDAAKCIAVGAAQDEAIWPYWMGKKEIKKALPIVAITTTSGTGSHMTQFSVITNPATKEKPGASSPHLFPRLSIVDPQLMVTLSPRMTAATGFDVLSHAIEAYTCNAATPFSDLFCERSIQLAGLYLRKAVQDGRDSEARAFMALADTYSGCAITQGITMCHAISHAVGGVCDTVHGETLAAMTPPAMRHSMGKSEEKFRKIGALFSGREKIPEGWTTEDTVKSVESVIRDIGLDIPLSEQGVARSDFEKIIEGTIGYMGGGCSLDPAAPISAEDVRKVLEQSFKEEGR